MTLTSKKLAAAVLAITVAMSLSACSNWSKRDRNTALVPVPVLSVVQY
jgi:osmotically inducible lipoprotein OsmB